MKVSVGTNKILGKASKKLELIIGLATTIIEIIFLTNKDVKTNIYHNSSFCILNKLNIIKFDFKFFSISFS